MSCMSWLGLNYSGNVLQGVRTDTLLDTLALPFGQNGPSFATLIWRVLYANVEVPSGEQGETSTRQINATTANQIFLGMWVEG